MVYEIAESKDFPGEWRVEGIGDDGECHVTIFSGPEARERAFVYLGFASALSTN